MRAESPIKVAFWFDRPIAYSGGLNYFRNLLFAISEVNQGRIEPYLFLSRDVPGEIVRPFESLARIVRTSVLSRGRPAWLFNRVLVRCFGSQILVKRELAKRSIGIISHAEHVPGLGRRFRSIWWLPDFQFLHLPDFFPQLDVAREKLRLIRGMRAADVILLSSRSAYEDFLTIAPRELAIRAQVLRFVSQPDPAAAAGGPADRSSIDQRYGLDGPYFYLPNQFWIHKNHGLVFEAVAKLKARGLSATVVCTGSLQDYRSSSTAYVDGLKRYIERNDLTRNIRILGVVPYADVLLLMRYCIAVINPSKFEGWSSSVEEARSTGKPVILSRIGVHMEQDPPGARYFDPSDAAELSAIMQELWLHPHSAEQRPAALVAADLRERTVRFGNGYVALVRRLAGVPNAEGACVDG